MAHVQHTERRPAGHTPYWSQVLRALRTARGITQEGWAAQLHYSRATVRRWEAGQSVPSADAEREIIALCEQKQLFRTFSDGPLLGVHLSPDWLNDLLAIARLGTESTGFFLPLANLQLHIPPVQYATNGDVSIAYQVIGEGPLTIVITPGAISHREVDWEIPGIIGFLSPLFEMARVIVYDKRGTGLSDRVPTASIEDRVGDICAVMDDDGCDRAVMYGMSEGATASIKFAATFPDRTVALVLYGAYARAPQSSLKDIDRYWDSSDSGFLERFAPSIAADPHARRWWARYLRMGASPGAVRDLIASNTSLKVEALLPTVTVPTLVVHRSGDRVSAMEQGRELAERIPNARLVELPGDDHLPWVGNGAAITAAVSNFLAERIPTSRDLPMLSTLVHLRFDTVDSPITVDCDDHCEVRYMSLESSNSGGEALITFDGPTTAIEFVQRAMNRSSSNRGSIRAGIHIGEVLLTDNTVSGASVRVCSALSAAALPGSVMVSRSVPQIVSGGTVRFREAHIEDASDILLQAGILEMEIMSSQSAAPS